MVNPRVVVRLLAPERHEQAVQRDAPALRVEFRVHIAPGERSAESQRMADDVGIAVLVDGHRGDVERGLGLPLNLVVVKDRPGPGGNLRHGVREGHFRRPPRVRLDQGRLAPRPEADHVPRVGDGGHLLRGRDENEVNRFLHDGAFRDLDVASVGEEGRVERDERVVLVLRVPREVLLDAPRIAPQDLGEGGDPHALRERTQIREAGRELPVHEHEASRLQDAEQEGFEPLRHDAIGPTQDRGLEWHAKEGREVREPPVLVLLGGETHGLEAGDGFLTDRTEPRRAREVRLRRGEFRDPGLLRVQRHGHVRHRPRPGPAAASVPPRGSIRSHASLSSGRGRHRRS